MLNSHTLYQWDSEGIIRKQAGKYLKTLRFWLFPMKSPPYMKRLQKYVIIILKILWLLRHLKNPSRTNELGQIYRNCKTYSLLFLESSKRAKQRTIELDFLQKWRETDNAVLDLKGYGIYVPPLPQPKLEDKSNGTTAQRQGTFTIEKDLSFENKGTWKLLFLFI